MRFSPAMRVGDGALQARGAAARTARRVQPRSRVLVASGPGVRSRRAVPARAVAEPARGRQRGARAVNGTIGTPVLEGRDLVKHFSVKQGRGLFARRSAVHAVDNVSVRLDGGRVTALVGESGSGKTTVARLLARIIRPDSGQVLLDGRPAPSGRPRAYAAQVQMVFQDPFASLNPVHRIRHHLARPLQIHHLARGNVDAAVEDLLRRVALEPPADFSAKFPDELSGGQRQRVAIARALAVQPRALIADEPVSMLDVSIRLGVLNLLAGLRERERLAILYVTHDLASARHLAD